MKYFLLSRDSLCISCLSLNPDDWRRCKLPGNHKYDSTYTMTFKESHLDIQKYDCGCTIYNNKYYPEFKHPEAIFKDFFHETIPPGEKLVKIYVNKTSK